MSKPHPDPRRQGGGRRKAESPRAARRREQRQEQEQHHPAYEGRRRAVGPDDRLGSPPPPAATEEMPGDFTWSQGEASYRGRRVAAAPVARDPAENASPVGWGSQEQAAPEVPAAQGESPGRQRSARLRRVLVFLGALVWLGGFVAAALGFAERQGWIGVEDLAPRVGSVVATWVAVIVLTRRAGGRPVLVGIFAAALLGSAAAFPENWALAGAAVVTATTYGLLGAVLTRPAGGVRALRELLVSAFVGLLGAVVVSGYDVSLRTLRFRILVLAAVLIAGFALAWRMGQGARSLGRRGIVLILAGALLIAISIAYTRAITAWGSPEVVQSVHDARAWMLDHLGAVPRPVESIVGFPTLLWGVAIRARRRQGWWMCAFGALGATGVATAFLQKGADPGPTLLATGYNLVIGAVIGLLLIGIDRLLTGTGRRSREHGEHEVDRPEPARFEPLL